MLNNEKELLDKSQWLDIGNLLKTDRGLFVVLNKDNLLINGLFNKYYRILLFDVAKSKTECVCINANKQASDYKLIQ